MIALAAALAAFMDYLLKAEVVAWLGKGEPLVRFFGLFYAASALAAFLVQALLGRVILARIGLGGSVASHPLLVGAAGVLGFLAPAPWRAILPRGLDVTLRGQSFGPATSSSTRRCPRQPSERPSRRWTWAQTVSARARARR